MDISVVDGKKIRYWDLKRNGWKYELESCYSCMVPIYPDKPCQYPKESPFVTLSPEGLLWFKAGYAWDGCSGPTLDGPTNMRGGLKHDGLYQLMGNGGLDEKWRIVADEVLRDTCIEDGMWRWRANLYYYGVRLGGGPSAKKGREEVADHILEAP